MVNRRVENFIVDWLINLGQHLAVNLGSLENSSWGMESFLKLVNQHFKKKKSRLY